MEQTLTLNINVLSWAAQKAGKQLNDFVRKLSKKEETQKNILKGELTLAQIKSFSKEAKVPFGYFFLNHPPEDFELDPSFLDFRTIEGKKPQLSDGFIETYKDILFKQNWYKDYLIEEGAAPLEFIGKYKNKNIHISTVAQEIRHFLNFVEVFNKSSNSEILLTKLIIECESKGILVFKNSVVINNTRNHLNTEEFRGFVVADPYAPVIFLNANDSDKALLFTLAHELAHLWLGDSGLSDTHFRSRNNNEIRCNAIAAEVLISKDEFKKEWDSLPLNSINDKFSSLSKKFKVSVSVIARIASELSLISKNDYDQFYAMIKAQYNSQTTISKSTPIKHIYTVRNRNSRTITSNVFKLYKNNLLSAREVSNLLNIRPTSIGGLMNE